jgi:hypothetical protein
MVKGPGDVTQWNIQFMPSRKIDGQQKENRRWPRLVELCMAFILLVFGVFRLLEHGPCTDYQ